MAEAMIPVTVCIFGPKPSYGLLVAYIEVFDGPWSTTPIQCYEHYINVDNYNSYFYQNFSLEVDTWLMSYWGFNTMEQYVRVSFKQLGDFWLPQEDPSWILPDIAHWYSVTTTDLYMDGTEYETTVVYQGSGEYDWMFGGFTSWEYSQDFQVEWIPPTDSFVFELELDDWSNISGIEYTFIFSNSGGYQNFSGIQLDNSPEYNQSFAPITQTYWKGIFTSLKPKVRLHNIPTATGLVTNIRIDFNVHQI